VTNTVTSGSGSGGGGTGSTINPGDFVVLDSASKFNAGGGERRVEVTLRNDGQTTANVTSMRFSFYKEDENNLGVTDADVYDGSGNFLLNLPIRGVYQSVPGNQTIAPDGGTTDFQFAFDTGKGDYDPDSQKDFFIVEVVYNEAYEATYFVNFE
jgi:hypothetical protein